MNSNVNELLKIAINYFNESDYENAKKFLNKILLINQDDFVANRSLGVIYGLEKKYDLAVQHFKKSYNLKPNDITTIFNLAKSLSDNKKDNEALNFHQKAENLLPNNIDVKLNYGKSLFNLEKFDEAEKCFHKILTLDQNHIEAWTNLGVIRQSKNLFEESVSFFEKAISINPKIFNAWNLKGYSLLKLKKINQSLDCFNKASSLNKNSSEVILNKGILFLSIGDFETALELFDKAINLDNNSAHNWQYKGIALLSVNKYENAIEAFNKALSLDKNKPRLLGNLIHTMQIICDWTNIDNFKNDLLTMIKENKSATTPFAILSLIDSPKIHLDTAIKYVQKNFGSRPSQKLVINSGHNRKIKLAYFSADFHEHPVSQLMKGVFEKHDLKKFELYAFSFGSKKEDNMKKKLKTIFENFIEIHEMSDLEAAKLSQSLKIDIAIDLTCHTKNSRMGIFAHQPAPIKINYLGYPGTSGANYYDYILADKYTLPEDQKKFFTEKVKYLPNCYLPPKPNIEIQNKEISREKYNLPVNKFIFCCFNNSYKLLPNIFQAWIKILNMNQDSILWLAENNDLCKKNIIKFAKQNNFDTNRIYFAQRLKNLNDHLLRYQLADLFLDTSPYNGHATTLDALGMGLPVLTYPGASFASRVSTSILYNYDLKELVCHDLDDYINRADYFCKNKDELNILKNKIYENLNIKYSLKLNEFVQGFESQLLSTL